MLSGESKRSPNESNMSQGYSGGYTGLEVREEIGGGGVIFSATGEKNHKWLHAKSTPPFK